MERVAIEYGLQALRFFELRVNCRAIDSWSAPPTADNVLRSAFGRALFQLSGLRGDGAYAYLFETASPNAQRGDRAPHPFVLRFRQRPAAIRPGALIELDLILIGKATACADRVMEALQQTGIDGLDKSRFRFKLEGAAEILPIGGARKMIYDGVFPVAGPELRSWVGPRHSAPITELTLRTLSPLHLVQRGAIDQTLAFSTLIRRILRRASTLASVHCDEELDIDYHGLIAQAERVEITSSTLALAQATRYSSRQGKTMPLKGVVGDVRYAGADLRPFLPILDLGALLQVGKKTAFGQGRYQIQVRASDRRRRSPATNPLGYPAPIKVKS